MGHDLQLVSELEVVSALREPGVFFTSGELGHFASSVVPLESLAGAFAAKEALFKALPPAGTTWFWTDAELVHDTRGAPRFRVHGSLADHLARRRMRVSVSISHSGGFATSVVIVTGGRYPPAGIRSLPAIAGTISRTVLHVLRRVTAHAAGTPQRP